MSFEYLTLNDVLAIHEVQLKRMASKQYSVSLTLFLQRLSETFEQIDTVLRPRAGFGMVLY